MFSCRISPAGGDVYTRKKQNNACTPVSVCEFVTSSFQPFCYQETREQIRPSCGDIETAQRDDSGTAGSHTEQKRSKDVRQTDTFSLLVAGRGFR